MNLLLLLASGGLSLLASALPTPGTINTTGHGSSTGTTLNLPKELRGIEPSALASCGGGTGFCDSGRCLCSGFCEGICDWYECGSC